MTEKKSNIKHIATLGYDNNLIRKSDAKMAGWSAWTLVYYSCFGMDMGMERGTYAYFQNVNN